MPFGSLFDGFGSSGTGGSSGSGIVNNIKYVATGNEWTTLIIPTIVGKDVLLIARESLVQYQVSSSPNTTEFIWDGSQITLGLQTNSGERFLILYRNY